MYFQMNQKYIPFSHYVIRTPLLPISEVNADSINLFQTDPLIRKAIYLASPDLFDSLHEYFNGQVSSEKKRARIRNSFLKYISRMTTRCTPFGLFAGCGAGEMGDKNAITMDRKADFLTKSRLDMDYLCELSIYLSRNHTLKPFLKYYPNTSIYEMGSEIRYVEYRYNNSKRTHFSVSIEKDEFVVEILKKCKSGAMIQELVELFPLDEYELEEITAFIDELIESQLLICELEPSVCGDDYLHSLIEIIDRVSPESEISNRLQSVHQLLEHFDRGLYADNLQLLAEIEINLDFFPIKRKRNFLFQVDSIIRSERSCLDSGVGNSILESINVLSRFIRSTERTYQEEFKRSFYKRFEDRAVPLGKVFDSESGISYVSGANGVPCPLIDDISFTRGGKQREYAEWRPVDSFLMKKLSSFSAENDLEILITDEDLDKLPKKECNLGNTFYAIAQLAKHKDLEKELINLSTIGGSSAANLLGRFCTSNSSVESLVRCICNKEVEMESGKMIAEISHLPESRTGNVLLRPHLYNYEIPYLSNSNHPNGIRIEDLEVSVQSGNKIILNERRSQKEIVPKLTTAHNFSYNSLPVYHFLCDLQYQDKIGGLGFNWGPLERDHKYLPRVRYKNVVLSLAKWTFSKKDVENLYDYLDHDESLATKMSEFRKKHYLKREVELVEGDNTLYVDLENLDLLRMLLQMVKKRSSFVLQEFFFSDHDSIVKGGEHTFANQFIIPFYKSN
jgi:hypothetical protein